MAVEMGYKSPSLRTTEFRDESRERDLEVLTGSVSKMSRIPFNQASKVKKDGVLWRGAHAQRCPAKQM